MGSHSDRPDVGAAVGADVAGVCVGRGVGAGDVGSIVGTGVGSDVVGSEVVGSDVVGSEVVGPDVGSEVVGSDVVGTEVVGSDVVGSDVVGDPVGPLEGAEVSAHCTPQKPSAHKQLNPTTCSSSLPEPSRSAPSPLLVANITKQVPPL